MTVTIFYSWQSDTKAAANRTLIQNALEGAVKELRADNSILVEPVIERDTKGIPGAPDIGLTILEKIDASAVVVADVTIVGRYDGRPTPNPNVLIELGYALKSVGSRRVILVQNLAFGGPEDLPFDLRQKRVLTYTSPDDASERASERRHLQANLKKALALVFTDPDVHRPHLSDDAKHFLFAAADGGGDIMCLHVVAGTIIEAGGRQMAEMGDRREEVRWEAALRELVDLGLVEPRGNKDGIFTVTHAGYQIAGNLKTQMGSNPQD